MNWYNICVLLVLLLSKLCALMYFRAIHLSALFLMTKLPKSKTDRDAGFTFLMFVELLHTLCWETWRSNGKYEISNSPFDFAAIGANMGLNIESLARNERRDLLRQVHWCINRRSFVYLDWSSFAMHFSRLVVNILEIQLAKRLGI